MKASIIIPARNAQATLANCLHAVLQQAEPCQDYEIIVVDDGSHDHTAAMAVNDRVQVLRQDQYGTAAARNAGLRRAQGEIVIFLDADCVPKEGWLQAMLAPFDNPAVVGVSGRIETLQKGLLPIFIQLEYDQRFDRLEKSTNVDFVTSATGGFRRTILLDAGGFSEDFLGAEDAELSFRLAEMGYQLCYVSEAVVYHHHPTSIWSYARRKCHYAYWRMEVYRHFKGKLIADSRTPQSQKLQILFLFLLVLSLAGATVWPRRLSPISVALFLAYLLLIAPTIGFVIRRNFRVGLMSPLLLTTSSLAAAIGIALAILSRFLPISPLPTQNDE